MPATNLNEIIHQPVRTRIMAYLSSVDSCDFATLKKALQLSDGHMSTHMKVLQTSGYISVSKNFEGNKPKTTYRITAAGRDGFRNYLEALKRILGQ